MKPNIISSFAAGLLVATCITGSIYLFGTNKPTSTNQEKSNTKTEEQSEEEMKGQLSAKGYIVLSDEEWNKQLAEIKATQQSNETSAEPSQEKIVYRTMLSVSEGMTSIDVGNALVEAKVITDAMGFFKEVENRGLANNLRPGMYTVDSSMSMDDLMTTFFN